MAQAAQGVALHRLPPSFSGLASSSWPAPQRSASSDGMSVPWGHGIGPSGHQDSAHGSRDAQAHHGAVGALRALRQERLGCCRGHVRGDLVPRVRHAIAVGAGRRDAIAPQRRGLRRRHRHCLLVAQRHSLLGATEGIRLSALRQGGGGRKEPAALRLEGEAVA